jgi:sugar O-acyltransferase (sialic acid O-acetyltransferase NeuD family)
MSRTLYVIGTGGFAKEVAQLADVVNSNGTRRWSSIEYLCETPDEIAKPMPFGKVTGTDETLAALTTPADFAIGIGIPKVRQRLAFRLSQNPFLSAPNLVHPNSEVDPVHVHLGRGNLITRGSAFTCAIEVGDFNVFNLNCTIGHDCRIGSFNVINPGCNISGGVHLADACLLGTGSLVLEGLGICDDVVVGGGAVVSKSIHAPGVYIGVPARPLR